MRMPEATRAQPSDVIQRQPAVPSADQIEKTGNRAAKAKAAKETAGSVSQQPEKPQPAPQRPREEKQLQRAVVPDTSGPDAAPPIVNDALRSPGQPLDAATRRFMEPRLGMDLGGVRAHSDSKANDSARAVNALAYTVGMDIVFGSQQYHPATQAGRRLLAHELTHVAQQAGGEAQVQRTCDPKPLSRAEFLKQTGIAAKDAPFGLTSLAIGDVEFPAVVLVQAPHRKKGESPAWTLSQTSAALPDPIPSFYTTGIFDEETSKEFVVPDGPCQGKYNKATFWIVGNAPNLLKLGELEHCADFQYAFDISLMKFAAAVNDLAGTDRCSDTKEKCEEHFRRKLEKKTGVAPEQWPDVFTCLAMKSQTVRDKRKLLHDPVTKTELSKDCRVRIRMTDLPGLGTAPFDIIKCPEKKFSVPPPKTPPRAPGSAKSAGQGDVGDK